MGGRCLQPSLLTFRIADTYTSDVTHFISTGMETELLKKVGKEPSVFIHSSAWILRVSWLTSSGSSAAIPLSSESRRGAILFEASTSFESACRTHRRLVRLTKQKRRRAVRRPARKRAKLRPVQNKLQWIQIWRTFWKRSRIVESWKSLMRSSLMRRSLTRNRTHGHSRSRCPKPISHLLPVYYQTEMQPASKETESECSE